MAVQSGHADVVQALLGAGADANAARATDCATPLHAAARGGRGAIRTAPVAAGASLQAADADGRFPADLWRGRPRDPGFSDDLDLDVAVATGLALRADAAARRADAALACVALHVASGRVAVPPPNVVVSLLAALR